MTPIPHIAILVPLLVGIAVSLFTILIHLLPVRITLELLRREKRHGRIGTSFWIDITIFLRVVLFASLAHIIEVALWGLLFVLCGEFRDFSTAFYHSAVNYTSLGYGDIVMSPSWRLLGPIETANGLLLFGFTTALIIAVLQRLLEPRFSDLRES
jgi:carbon starvation protein CstA